MINGSCKGFELSSCLFCLGSHEQGSGCSLCHVWCVARDGQEERGLCEQTGAAESRQHAQKKIRCEQTVLRILLGASTDCPPLCFSERMQENLVTSAQREVFLSHHQGALQQPK